MAVPDAFRPQASAWGKFLVGIEASFVLRPVGKVTPNPSPAQLDEWTSPDLRFASERGGAAALPCTPPQNLWFPSADYQYVSMQSEAFQCEKFAGLVAEIPTAMQ